jgi:hypothetical protein
MEGGLRLPQSVKGKPADTDRTVTWQRHQQ